MLVLGQPIAGGDVRKLVRGAEAVRPACRFVVEKRHRRGGVVGMKWIGDWRFDGLVVFGKRPIDHAVAEEPADALAIHDERQPRFRVVRVHRRRIVRNITDPLAAVP